jgi:purine-binding chemotaxis protein CheW
MAQSSTNQIEHVAFSVDEMRLAMPSSAVASVVRAVAVEPLPGAPAVVAGAINVRGAVVAVVDLRARFRRASPPIRPSEYFLLARAGARTVAVRADAAPDLVTLGNAAVTPIDALAAGLEPIAGAARTEDGLVVVFDLDALLTEAESLDLDRAIEEIGGDV